jgi:hypothetical protein
MSVLDHYIRTRSARDAEFAEGLEDGYEAFKARVLLMQADEERELTPEAPTIPKKARSRHRK